MAEVFGKKTLSSREFPVAIFDAEETLFYSVPTRERFLQNFVQEVLKRTVTDEEMEAATIKISREWILAVEANDSVVTNSSERFLQEAALLGLTSQHATEALELYVTNAKLAFSQTGIAVCEVLKERGYMLAIATNDNQSLSELLRHQGMLDLFEGVYTASELGTSKPNSAFFEAVCDDLNIEPSQALTIGNSYAEDVICAQRAGILPILYDPHHRELRALHTDDADIKQKVVPLEALRNQRRLTNVTLISKLEDILQICL